MVRGQLVITSRRPTESSGVSAIRVWSGTESSTVLARATANKTALTQTHPAAISSGRHARSPNVVTPSIAIGRPTTWAVRR